MSALPAPSSLSSLPPDQRFQVLDTLFEPSPELHAIMDHALATQSFSSYASLVDAVDSRLSTLSTAHSTDPDQHTLIKILGSHPRLGRAPAKETIESLSELSEKEQANLNTTGAEEQTERLLSLNEKYEERFPGLRFVTFVNGRSREVIMEEMRRRIDRGDRNREVEAIIEAMSDIARDRVRKLTIDK